MNRNAVIATVLAIIVGIGIGYFFTVRRTGELIPAPNGSQGIPAPNGSQGIPQPNGSQGAVPR